MAHRTVPLLLTAALLLLPALSDRPVSYDGFSILEMVPTTDAEVSWVQGLPCRSLTDWVGVARPVQLLCDRRQARGVRQAARRAGVTLRAVSRNLGSQIREEARTVDRLGAPEGRGEARSRRRRKRQKRKRQEETGEEEGRRRVEKEDGRRKVKQEEGHRHRSYLGTELISQWLGQLAARHPGVMQLGRIGRTAEGRDIQVVTLNAGNTSLPTIFIDAGIHAREWISPASILFFIEKAVRKLAKGRGQKDIGAFQWHIVPVANPDGYEYTRSTDRLWRKNTVAIPGSNCIGVDLNRNFPEGYGVGASKSPCSEVYQGSRPFSELESRALRDYLGGLKGVKAAISVHSFGNVLIYPWGYKDVQHPLRAPLSALARTVSAAVKEKTGELYQPGTAREVFGLWGLAGGATDDWYITQGIPYSYTFELPEFDENKKPHGFILPASNILRVGRQLLVGLTTMAAQLAKG